MNDGYHIEVLKRQNKMLADQLSAVLGMPELNLIASKSELSAESIQIIADAGAYLANELDR